MYYDTTQPRAANVLNAKTLKTSGDKDKGGCGPIDPKGICRPKNPVGTLSPWSSNLAYYQKRETRWMS